MTSATNRVPLRGHRQRAPTRLGPKWAEAFEFANWLHRDQVRKGSGVPYVTHLMSVAAIVLENGGSEEQAIAALLHDAIEDQGPRQAGGSDRLRAEIDDRFGAEVLRIVNGCTDADTLPKPPWAERKAAYIQHLWEADPAIALVAAADKIHNARTMLNDYYLVGADLWERFTADRDDQVAYLHACAAALKAHIPPNMHRELVFVVSELDEVSSDDPLDDAD